MSGKFTSTEAKIIVISRIILLLSIVLFASAAISIMIEGTQWLVVGLFTIGALLFCTSFMIPGILIVFRRSNLAYAWLRGRNPMMYTNVPWEGLPSNKRRFVFIDSMIGLIIMIILIFSFLRAWLWSS